MEGNKDNLVPKKEDEEFSISESDKSCLGTTNVGNSCKHGSDLVNESSNGKRKREDYAKMLNWILNVAKDPCDPEFGSLPERSKWKSYGDEKLWKQVLIARQMMCYETNVNSIFHQSPTNWTKRPMHPSLYKDIKRVRISQRVISAKEMSSKTQASSESSSGIGSDLEDDFSKHVPVGPYFQAIVPEWNKEAYESDSKWLGSRVWPLESEERKKYLVERERMGKGRQDSCGCQYQGSVECVRFHVAEKRNRIKLQLGSAFSSWKFDQMGEMVVLSWTKKEEERFQGVIRSNPPSQGNCFWDEIVKAFPNKKMEELVNYYYNVFLLQRRSYQNRSTPNKVDSDDEESVFGIFGSLADFRHETGKSPSSIFYSPKKTHLGS